MKGMQRAMSSPKDLGQSRIVLDELQAGELATELDPCEPQELLQWALETFQERLTLVTSFQAEGMALLDMAWHLDPRIRVLTVDTGRLPEESYTFMDWIKARYQPLNLRILFPDPEEVRRMVERHGANLFYHSVPQRLLCCQVRKVRPLVKALKNFDAWVTGLRRDQWASRANIRKIELDHDHGGIVKISPLADWMEEEVWEYLREHDVPSHPLYAQNHTSIGCTPCTRPTRPEEDKRAGRWWWEVGAPKECGIHCPIETGGFEHGVEAILGDHKGTGE